jgi:gluconate kinase
MDVPKTENKRKQYLDQIGSALFAVFAVISLLPEKYREKLRETYSILVQIYSET